MAARKPTSRREQQQLAGQAKKKQTAAEAASRLSINVLKSLNEEATEKDVIKVLTFLSECMNKEDYPTVKKVCEAIAEMSDTITGFFTLYRAGTLESLTQVLQIMQEEGIKATLDVQVAYNAMVQQAALWIAEVDHVEFFQLPQVLELAMRFAGEYKSVALSAVATLDRFAMQQAVHRVTILQAGGLHLLHRVLSAHRSPEFCQETLLLMFHICDVPSENVKPKLVAEMSLIQSVVETLDQAPVNMRLQVTGLRLLSMWANLEDKRITKAISEANAAETMKTVVESLTKAGFVHAAAWIDTIGGAALEEKEGKEKKKKAGSKSKSKDKDKKEDKAEAEDEKDGDTVADEDAEPE